MGEAMKHLIKLLYGLLCCVPSTWSSAQVWCPPGAAWNYNFMAGPSIGCETRTYVGDTTIEGSICQRIEVVDIVYDFIDDDIDTIGTSIITREVGGVVTQQRFTDQPLAAWDTLYWFSAPVGARWYPPGSAGDDCQGFSGLVEVLSIEEQVISGLALDVRTLGQLDYDGEVLFTGPDMIERIGTPLMFIPSTCPIGELGGSTLSYTDDTWEGYESGEVSNCDLFNGMPSIMGQKAFRIYPTPATDHVTLEGINVDLARMAVSVHDQLGRRLEPPAQSGYANACTFDVSRLPDGIYTISLTPPGKPVAHARLLIER